MEPRSLLRVGYALLVVQGLLSVLVPKKAIALATLGWRVGFENVGDLEPREWYVEVTRVLGVGFLAAGVAGLAVSRDATREPTEADVDFEDADDGPVTVNIDD
jgi:hypothetical protein